MYRTSSTPCTWHHGAMFALFVLLVGCLPASADAFCGFYVSGASEDLYNNATRVAMMREGQQTVMSMQNNYQGPPEDFAMVVPVPEVLKKEKVKTIEDGVFEELDELTAPRLVEYWQQDPCEEIHYRAQVVPSSPTVSGASASSDKSIERKVDIEAQFDVGEYEIVVLSAEESNALDTWLRQNDYNIPEGAAEYFRPYIQQGSYFFVAKVNIDKVDFENGRAVLSPLRFHYESDTFKLPVRLGLINSKGSQDLIAYLMGRNQRFRVANYPNETIPTNLPVVEDVKGKFGAFYDTLFERVLEDQPKAVVTEYAWNAGTCDPCPVAPLDRNQLATLGADVVGDGERPNERAWTVTRLHTRYDKETLGEDLVFEKAHAIRGGRGEPHGKEGKMTNQTPSRSSRNQFQARYIVRHFWEGDVDCEDPRWGRWGGRGGADDPPEASPAGDVGFRSASGDVQLDDAVEQKNVPGLEKMTEGGDEDRDSPSSEATSKDEESSTKTEPKPSKESGDEKGDASDDEDDGDDTSETSSNDTSDESTSEEVDLDEAVQQEDVPGVEKDEGDDEDE